MTFVNPELLGGVQPDEVTVNLDPFDLDVLGSVVSGRLRAEEPFSGELRVELSEEEIAEIATSFATSPVGEVELEEGRLDVGSEVELLGVRVPVSVEWELDVRDGVLRFEPVRAKALGEPVPEELLAGASFEYPIGELPVRRRAVERRDPGGSPRSRREGRGSAGRVSRREAAPPVARPRPLWYLLPWSRGSGGGSAVAGLVGRDPP